MMDTETLQREGTKRLFGKDLEAYRHAVADLALDTQRGKDLGDPDVVLDCLFALNHELRALMTEWHSVMQDALLDDDETGQSDGSRIRKNSEGEYVVEEILDPETGKTTGYKRVRNRSDNDEPDPVLSKDAENVRLDALAQSDFERRLRRWMLESVQ